MMEALQELLIVFCGILTVTVMVSLLFGAAFLFGMASFETLERLNRFLPTLPGRLAPLRASLTIAWLRWRYG